MTRLEIHEAWAPSAEPWSRWVKPVLFASIDETSAITASPSSDDEPFAALLGPRLIAPLEDGRGMPREVVGYRALAPSADTAMIVDLPGAIGARLGVGLVAHGFRPIPLYNAVPSSIASNGVDAIVDVAPLIDVLIDGAEVVSRARRGASPVFLLDANRTGNERIVKPGLFDNRSMCWPSDFPSADTMWTSGIRRVVVISDSIAPDAEPTLLEWQARGMSFWRWIPSRDGVAAPFVLEKRTWPRRWLHAIRRGLLDRRADGSYGRLVLDPRGSGG